jgi:hypothetical protein
MPVEQEEVEYLDRLVSLVGPATKRWALCGCAGGFFVAGGEGKDFLITAHVSSPPFRIIEHSTIITYPNATYINDTAIIEIINMLLLLIIILL